LWTNALIGSAATIMMPTETMTAVIMTHNSSTMPIAVMTESSEKTMSSSMICTITLMNDAATRPEACPSSPSSLSWISKVLLPSRNNPPPIRIRSRPETACPSAVKSGVVRRAIQAIENSSSTRVSIAPSSPIFRARFCWSGGSFPERIEMKMMLSTPRTISRKVSVARAIQICGSVSQSIISSSA
jgi:hypothetical protein